MGIPDYFKIIKEPMDLSTLSNNLKNDKYDTNISFEKDMKKIWDNALLYNK